ncbi:major facilitator superfamily domain-containing protein 6-like [Glandiceps talaboti]
MSMKTLLSEEPKENKTLEDGENEDAINQSKRTYKGCNINTRLLPVKLFYLFFFGGIGAVFPYLTVYYKQLGLNPTQIGILGGIRPFVGFIGGIVWGAIADKYRARRLVLLMSLSAWLGLLCAIGFVPPANEAECPLPPSLVQEYLQKSDSDEGSVSLLINNPSNTVKNAIDENIISKRFALSDNINKLQASAITTRSKERNKLSKYDVEGKANTTSDSEIASTIAILTNPSDTSWLYDPQDLIRVFAILATLTAFGEVMQSPTFSLGDTAALDNLEGDYSKYGSQRVWGSVGLGISSFSVGALINMTRHTYIKCGIQMVFSDYRVAFYVFAVVVLAAFIVTTRLRFKDHDTDVPSEHDLIYLFKLLCTVNHISVLMVSFFMGTSTGLIFGFLYWHLENIGASQLLMGTASLVDTTSEIGTFFISHHIIATVGHIGILCLGLASYIIRFIAYAYLSNPWWVLPVEILQGISFAASWVALTSYMALVVPCDSFATVQGILHGAYWGLGLGVGSIVGGLFIDSYGAVKTFIGFAFANCVILLLFIIVQWLSPKPEFLKEDYTKINGSLKYSNEENSNGNEIKSK